MDAVAASDEGGRRVRRNRMVLISRRWDQVSQVDLRGDGGYQARYTGESTYKPLTPLRGECRVVSAEPVVTAACFPCCRRAMGAACTRHSLRPPCFRGAKINASLGHFVPRERACSSRELQGRQSVARPSFTIALLHGGPGASAPLPTLQTGVIRPHDRPERGVSTALSLAGSADNLRKVTLVIVL